MGFSRFVANFICDTTRKHNISGSVLTLGRQNYRVKLGDMLSWHGAARLNAAEQRIEPSNERNERLTKFLKKHNIEISNNQYIDYCEPFLAYLGYDDIESVDVSGYQGATIIHDMNKPGLSNKAGKKFDIIIDSGTIEHIFDIKTALHNVFESLKIGGYIFHCSPANNFMDHGFYQISPTLLLDYYTANSFRVIDIFIAYVFTDDAGGASFEMRGDYIIWRDQRTEEIRNNLGPGKQLVYFLAQKLEHSTGDRLPDQGAYAGLPGWRPPQA